MKVTNLNRRLLQAARPQPASAGAAILAGGLVFSGSAEAQLFFEDFEGLALQDTVSTSETAATAVWTDVGPTGWSRDNTTTPTDGPAEFFGWTFVDKEWWITTAGDQSRSTFTRGQGNVMVMDPDEYDDLGDVDPNLINVFVETPAISTAGASANSLQLTFDSSFRPYPTMQGLVDVSYDGGATFENILTLDDTTVPGGTSSLQRANEAVVLDLNNPGNGGDLVVRYGIVNAGNDWWWAVDNVAVGSPDQFGISLEVAANGELFLANRSNAAISLDYYEIESESGSLSLTGWSSFEDQVSADGFPGGTGVGDGWEEGGNLSDDVLSESFLTGFGTLEAGESVSLGMGYDAVQDAEDLVFRYGAVPTADTTVDKSVGDFTGDGIVNQLDYDSWVGQFGQAGADLAADANSDGVVDAADYTIWRDNLGLEGGTVLAAGPSVLTDGFVNYNPTSATAVPEPSALVVCGLGVLALSAGRRS